MDGLARMDISMPDHLRRLLRHGRVMDTGRMVKRIGFTPRTSREAIVAALNPPHHRAGA